MEEPGRQRRRGAREQGGAEARRKPQRGNARAAARARTLNVQVCLRQHGRPAVDGLAGAVEDAAEHVLRHGRLEHLAGAVAASARCGDERGEQLGARLAGELDGRGLGVDARRALENLAKRAAARVSHICARGPRSSLPRALRAAGARGGVAGSQLRRGARAPAAAAQRTRRRRRRRRRTLAALGLSGPARHAPARPRGRRPPPAPGRDAGCRRPGAGSRFRSKSRPEAASRRCVRPALLSGDPWRAERHQLRAALRTRMPVSTTSGPATALTVLYSAQASSEQSMAQQGSTSETHPYAAPP